MSVITIQITTDGAAFEDGYNETGRILAELAHRIDEYRRNAEAQRRLEGFDNETTRRLFDVNGNACGQVDIATEVGD